MRTTTGRKIGKTYRYFSSAHSRKTALIAVTYAFLVFLLLSSAGRLVGVPFMVFLTLVAIMSLSVIFMDARSQDRNHFHKYTIKQESVDDHGNSRILVEWDNDKIHAWIPNPPMIFQRLRLIGE